MRFIGWLAVIVLLLGMVPMLAAQAPPAPAAPAEEKAPPVLQYLLAGCATALVLLILCTPTRKSQ